MRDFEREHRERVLRYQHRNAITLRLRARNKYRSKHGIPLDAPITRGRKIEIA